MSEKFIRETQEQIEERKARSEKHKIGKSHQQMTAEEFIAAEEAKKAKHAEMLARFAWASEDGTGSNVAAPTVPYEDIRSATATIVDYIVENATLDCYNSDEWSLDVPIPLTAHPLLAQRFNTEYSEDSRLNEFNRIKNVLEALPNSLDEQTSDMLKRLNNKVVELFPQQGNWKVSEVEDGMRLPDRTVTEVDAWGVSSIIVDDYDGITVDGEEASPGTIVVSLILQKLSEDE